MFGLPDFLKRPSSSPERTPSVSRRGSDAAAEAVRSAATSSASAHDSISDTDSFTREGRGSSRTSPASSRSASPRLTRLDKGKGRAVDASPMDAAFGRTRSAERAPLDNNAMQTRVEDDDATSESETSGVGASASAGRRAPAGTGAATQAEAAADTLPTEATPATKSQVETLVDGVYERLEATWAAIMALVQHVMGGLASAYGTAQHGLHTASAMFSRVAQATKSAVAGQLRNVQGFAAADVEVNDGAYARFKARTKTRVRNTCGYLLSKLQAAPAAAPAPATTAEANATNRA